MGAQSKIVTILSSLLLLRGLLCSPQAAAQATVSVSFTTTNTTPLNQGFAGFCTELQASAVEYYDANFQQMTATLSPGWLRYPGGSMDDAFAWTNGLTLTNWFTNFPSWETNLLWPAAKLGNGKGGLKFGDFAAMSQNVGGAKIVVTINGFTDSAGSAGAFAAYALSNHIPVSVWELCNEPYTLAGTGSGTFFLDATDYVAQMKPFRNAIKAADSNAVVAIYFNDAGYAEPNTWDNDLNKYSDKYWDAVVYHHYPALPTSGVTFADLMALDNWQLVSNTTARMTNYLIPDNNSNVIFLISEFAPCRGNGAGGNYPPTTTLYGGIYTAEYLLRLSTVPQMQFVGPYQLLDAAGIDQTNNNYQPVSAAYAGGYTTNTAGLPFGFFLSAQVCGQSIADWALTRSTAVYPTTVGTNGPVVPIDTNGIATMPAIYAQAYRGGNGMRYVVLTNKGSNAVPVQIMQDGVMLTNQFLETFVTGSDPGATNAPPPNNSVQIQSQFTNNPVTIPEYSVVRLEWTDFAVPQPVVALTYSNSIPTLHWTGLTNVVYNVQGVTNLLTVWPTLGKVASAQTNFSFSDPLLNATRFYRLTVP
ncbi:MAG TPA: hypothetical protein VMA35_08310 [Candidatus Sulfopaludibacter sp.]|nr:hypothetical protein [Candidatus Sulfopaludibacter sp.]